MQATESEDTSRQHIADSFGVIQAGPGSSVTMGDIVVVSPSSARATAVRPGKRPILLAGTAVVTAALLLSYLLVSLHQPSADTATGRPGQSASPPASPAESSSSPSTAPASGRSPAYLENMASSVASGTVPQSGSWILQGTSYPHSIGYSGDCSTHSVTYDLTGHHYKWFDAMAGSMTTHVQTTRISRSDSR